MANLQHLEVVAGENRTLTLHARDSANVPADLTNKTVTVYVGRPPNDPGNAGSIIARAGVVTGAAAGTFTLAILPTDTEYLSGDYEYQAKTTDVSNNIAMVCGGRFRVIDRVGT